MIKLIPDWMDTEYINLKAFIVCVVVLAAALFIKMLCKALWEFYKDLNDLNRFMQGD